MSIIINCKQNYPKIIERVLFLFLLTSLLLSSISIAEAFKSSSRNYPINLQNGVHNLNIESQNIAVQELLIFSTNKQNSYIEIENINQPIDKFLIARPSYEYFSLKCNLESKRFEITFLVSKEWLDNQNINEKAVTLYQFNQKEGIWEKAFTELKLLNKGFYTYVSKIEGDGYFVISDKDYVEEKIIMNNKEDDKNINKNNSNTINNNNNNNTKNNNENSFVELTLENPLEIKKKSYNKYILIGCGAIFLILLLKISKLNTKNKLNTFDMKVNNLNLIENIEKNVLNKQNKLELIQSEINSLEEKIALKIAKTLQENEFSPAEIRAKLISNNISQEVINKVIT